MNEIREFFGKNLKKLRVEQGFTQERLAEKIGINQRQLTRIETGRSFPSFVTLDNICNVLNISADKLFDFASFSEPNRYNGNTVFYIAHKTTSGILLKEKYKAYADIEEIEIAEEAELFQMSRNIKKQISVKYYHDKNIQKEIVYRPNGTAIITINVNKNGEIISEIIDGLNDFKSSLPKLKFLKLAIKCLDDKKSIEKMQNILEGMLL